jgi:hypothetical protein
MPEIGLAITSPIIGSRYAELTTFTLYSTRSFQELPLSQRKRLLSVLPLFSVAFHLSNIFTGAFKTQVGV